MSHVHGHGCKCTEFIDHPAQARRDIHVFPDKLYVITVLENPLRWSSRYKNYFDFAKHVADAGAVLLTVELAQGDRMFEVTSDCNPYHVQLRTRDEMFHKENLCNIGAWRLPLGIKYLSFVDADFIFTRPDWAQETLHQLQHFDVVQMFSSYSDLSSCHSMGKAHPSFMYNYWNWSDASEGGDPMGPYYGVGKYGGAPGGAWAYRTGAFKTLGSLMDKCILGAADAHMAVGLVQKDTLQFLHQEIENGTEAYKRYIQLWQANAARLNKNIGYVETHAIHKFHGPRAARQYGTRWKLLQVHEYDPWADVQPNEHGVFEWTGKKPDLRDGIRQYMRSRNEDSPSDC
jgi:hypothetical protein